MSVLRIFDCSQYIYSGSSKLFIDGGIREVGGSFEEVSMPSGGLASLLETVYEHYYEPDTTLVYCFDRPPRIKREIYQRVLTPLGFTQYKGNRPPKDPSIVVQRQMAEEVMNQLGLNVVAVENLEADDCIASIVKYNKYDYDKVYIHSLDSDLFYLVDGTVEIVPLYERRGLPPRGKYINRSNWETAVRKDVDVTYNCLTMIKMCKGEPGDNIPRIAQKYINAVYTCVPRDEFHKCGDMEFLRERIKQACNNDTVTMGIFDLIAPVIAKPEDVVIYEDDLQKDLLDYYASVSGCQKAPACIIAEPSLAVETVNKYLNQYMEVIDSGQVK